MISTNKALDPNSPHHQDLVDSFWWLSDIFKFMVSACQCQIFTVFSFVLFIYLSLFNK